jgi:hypothetical protein
VNLRPKHIFPGGSILAQPYIHNASSTIPVRLIPARDFQAFSLRDLALLIRRAITEYDADIPAFEHELRWRNAHPMVRLYRCPPWNESELQTNWCEGETQSLSELDFSPVRSRSGSDWEKKKSARVLFVLTDTVVTVQEEYKCEEVPPLLWGTPSWRSRRGNGAILMENADSIWMSQVKGRKEWEELRRSGHFRFIKFE